MGIRFEPDLQGQIANVYEQILVTQLLQTCIDANAFSYLINVHFNNVLHTISSSTIYNINEFLAYLFCIANASDDLASIHVIGGLCQDDPHVSLLLGGQYVRDFFVKIYVTVNGSQKLSESLVPGQMYNFIVTVPEVLQ